MSDTHHYVTPDGTRYRIMIESDPDAMSPRDADNLTLLVLNSGAMVSPDDGYVKPSEFPAIPDGEYIETRRYSGGVDMRRIRKYVALFCPDVLAIAGLDVYADWSPTLSLSDDDETDGYVVITRTAWNNLMGSDVIPTASELREYMRQDIDAYNRWASGEYVSFIVEQSVNWTRPDTGETREEWDTVEYVGSIDDAEYALSEARSYLPDDAEPFDPGADTEPDDIDTLDCRVITRTNHSDDRVTYYHGSVIPLRLCGFHASAQSFVNRILAEGK